MLWRLLGDAAAPTGWLLIARTGALVAVGLGARLAYRLANGSRLAAVVATLGLLTAGGMLFNGAVGNAEGLALAFGLGTLGLALDGRHRAALTVGLALALLRPESWPFLALYAAWAVRDGAVRPRWALGGALAILVLWFAPEWVGSGDPFRSGARALLPNPGAPATAAVPAWTALRLGLTVPAAGLLVAALASAGVARWIGLLGLAWLLEVALMAQVLGTSGELRYSLPGAGLLVVAGAVGVSQLLRRTAAAKAARAPRSIITRLSAVALVGLVAGTLLARLDDVAAELRDARDDAELALALPAAVAAAGGAERLVACGRPVVGRFRGPLAAWTLGVARRRIEAPAGTGPVVLRSRVRPGARLEPPAPAGARLLGRSERWRIEGRCPRR